MFSNIATPAFCSSVAYHSYLHFTQSSSHEQCWRRVPHSSNSHWFKQTLRSCLPPYFNPHHDPLNTAALPNSSYSLSTWKEPQRSSLPLGADWLTGSSFYDWPPQRKSTALPQCLTTQTTPIASSSWLDHSSLWSSPNTCKFKNNESKSCIISGTQRELGTPSWRMISFLLLPIDQMVCKFSLDLNSSVHEV